MNYEKLKAIRNEVLRFDKTLKKAMDEAILIKDVVGYSGKPYNKGIAGTHLSGAVKRKYIDMKYEINKIIKP